MDFMKTSDKLSLFICHVRETINSLKYLATKVCDIVPYDILSRLKTWNCLKGK